MKTTAAGDWRFGKFYRDQAKITIVVETFVLDTRTSIVPSTGVVTEQADIEMATSGFSIYETQLKSRIEGEKQACMKVVADISTLLSSRIGR